MGEIFLSFCHLLQGRNGETVTQGLHGLVDLCVIRNLDPILPVLRHDDREKEVKVGIGCPLLHLLLLALLGILLRSLLGDLVESLLGGRFGSTLRGHDVWLDDVDDGYVGTISR